MCGYERGNARDGECRTQHASWLQSTQRCRFSSIANYLNGLVSVLSYCYAHLDPSDAVLNSDPNPLSQIINLRAQAEKAAILAKIASLEASR